MNDDIPEELSAHYEDLGLAHSAIERRQQGHNSCWWHALYPIQTGRCLPRILDGTLCHIPESDEIACAFEFVYKMNFDTKVLKTYSQYAPNGRFVDRIAFKDIEEEYPTRLQKLIDSEPVAYNVDSDGEGQWTLPAGATGGPDGESHILHVDIVIAETTSSHAPGQDESDETRTHTITDGHDSDYGHYSNEDEGDDFYDDEVFLDGEDANGWWGVS